MAHVDPVEEAPDPPSLAIVERAGIPAVDAGRYAQATAALTTRRALLCAFVNSDGWGWGESTRPPEA